jgi:hypothetical protein
MKFALPIFTATALLMHAYPFWIAWLLNLENAPDFWHARSTEIFVNLACAILVGVLNCGIVRKFAIAYLGALGLLSTWNILKGLQVYALMAIIVDAWSLISVHFVRKKYDHV